MANVEPLPLGKPPRAPSAVAAGSPTGGFSTKLAVPTEEAEPVSLIAAASAEASPVGVIAAAAVPGRMRAASRPATSSAERITPTVSAARRTRQLSRRGVCSAALRAGEVGVALLHGHRLLLAEVPDRDHPALDLHQRPRARVLRQPLRTAHRRRPIPALRPETPVPITPQPPHPPTLGRTGRLALRAALQRTRQRQLRDRLRTTRLRHHERTLVEEPALRRPTRP